MAAAGFGRAFFYKIRRRKSLPRHAVCRESKKGTTPKEIVPKK